MDTITHEGETWTVLTRTRTRLFITRNGIDKWIDAD